MLVYVHIVDSGRAIEMKVYNLGLGFSCGVCLLIVVILRVLS